jgi:hypothetical protein
MSKDIKQFVGLTHSQGGRFSGVRSTGHILYWVLMLPNGLNPFVAKASLKFLGFVVPSWRAAGGGGRQGRDRVVCVCVLGSWVSPCFAFFAGF